MAFVWQLKARPLGRPKLSDFELRESELASLQPGQLHVKNVLNSVDPYMRLRMNSSDQGEVPSFQVGEALYGGALGEVLQSSAPGFKTGDLVTHNSGWRDEAIVDADHATLLHRSDGVPIDVYLGILGGPGMAAYFGLLEVASVQAGEVVFISGAAGAVGSAAVQFARLKDCFVIGSAGGDSKCNLVRDLGAHSVIDYKKPGSFLEKLRAAAPQGIDVFFDNVGEEQLDAALALAKQRARFALCGMISGYNRHESSARLTHLPRVITSRITMKGFISLDFLPQKHEFEAYVGEALRLGKVRSCSTVINGLEAMPEAFIGLFEGSNQGKMLVRVDRA